MNCAEARAIVAAVVVAGLVTAGCSSSSRSSTPRLSVQSGSPLAALALTDADVTLIPSARIGAVQDLTAYQDPDPRTPCGKPLALPDFSTGGGVAITAPSETGVELLASLGADRATAFVDALIADARAGCPAFQTTTNTGSTQSVRLEAASTLDGIGDRAIVTIESITNAGRTAIATRIAVARNGVLALVVLLGASPLGPDAARTLAQRVDARLGG